MVKNKPLSLGTRAISGALSCPRSLPSWPEKNNALKSLVSNSYEQISWGERELQREFWCPLFDVADNDRNLFRKIGVACFGVIRACSYSGETAFKYCWIRLSEAGFPRRSVPLKSPWRPTSENRERILPMYIFLHFVRISDSGVKVMLHGTILNDNF